jgi:hypothetical protein
LAEEPEKMIADRRPFPSFPWLIAAAALGALIAWQSPN